MQTIKLTFFGVAIAILGVIPALSALQSKAPAPAPVPVQIATAQRAFVSNAGGESFENVIDQTVFDGGPDRPYNQFYAAMKNWGRYNLVSSPADADVVFEVSWALTDTGLRLPFSDSFDWWLSIQRPTSHSGISLSTCVEPCCWVTGTRTLIKP